MANNTLDQNLKKQRYICCFVPLCQNNNKKSPNTLFFHVPNNEEVKKNGFEQLIESLVIPKLFITAARITLM